MNNICRRKYFPSAARWLAVLLAVLALPLNGPAQPNSPQRWLLIFETSSWMKNRQPATAEVLKNFFATGAGGRLQPGDNIGVWTIDQKLHAGQFPLTIWDTNQAPALTSNLAAFLKSRTHAGDGQLSLLQPALNGVIGGSERLTILIFCDGETGLSGTPYDSGVNQNYLDNRAERRKSRQPFVVLMRTLSGKYIGCTVNYPPGPINMPPFPPPAPITNLPPPAPAEVLAPVVKRPSVVVPDLIIVGTNVGGTISTPSVPAPPPTNSTPVEIPQPVGPSAKPPVTNIPPITKPAPAPAPAPTPVPAPPAMIAITNPPPAVTATNHAAPPPPMPSLTTNVAETNKVIDEPTNLTNADADRPTWLLILIGVGLLLAAVVIVLLLIFRSGRRSQGSLITRSMEDDPRNK